MCWRSAFWSRLLTELKASGVFANPITELGGLLDAFCAKQGLSRASAKLKFDGDVLADAQTAKGLELEDDERGSFASCASRTSLARFASSTLAAFASLAAWSPSAFAFAAAAFAAN